MEIYESENRKLSNKLYNHGLKRAMKRDLFGASVFLKKALLFNNKNINARNLLGLIFYEEGEVAEAVYHWILSRDISKESLNPANDYLYRVQNDEGTEKLINSIKVYNDAIDDIKIERYDLAMVKLYKSISENDHNVKAMLLLSLLLIRINDNVKAGTYLQKCRQIDKGNKSINDYMEYVIKHTKKGEAYEKRIRNVFSSKKLESDESILSKRYIKITDNQKIIFILIGILVGGFSYALLFNPIKSGISSENDREIIRYADKVNDQNKIIRDITIENNELKKNYEDASVKLRAYEDQNRTFTSQYETLNAIIKDYDSGYISRAAKLYVDLDKDSISDPNLVELLNQARSRIEGIGAKRLCELGTESWNGGNKSAAEAYYRLSLSINPDDPETMFLLARLLQNQEKYSEANKIFDKIISQHPGSNYAKRSREARGY